MNKRMVKDDPRTVWTNQSLLSKSGKSSTAGHVVRHIKRADGEWSGMVGAVPVKRVAPGEWQRA